MEDDGGLLTYILMGSVIGLLSHFVFGWSVGLAIILGVFGPFIVGFVLLIAFLIVYAIIGD